MTQIYRDTAMQKDDYVYNPDHPDELEGPTPEIKNILNKVDYSKYLWKSEAPGWQEGQKRRKGTFKPEFYKKVKGKFESINLGGATKKAIVEIIMDTPEAEIVAGILLENENRVNQLDVSVANIKTFARIANYTKLPFFTSFKSVYLDNLKYINAQISEGNNQPKYVLNNENSKLIKMDSYDYKKIYGQIKLKNIVYKDLSKYLTKEYEIKECCVSDYISKLVGDKKFKETIKYIFKYDIDVRDGFDYKQIIEIARYYNFTCIARNILRCEIDRYDHDVSKKHKKQLDFMINMEHMHVLDKEKAKPVKKYVIINNLSEIDDHKYCNLIVTDDILFKEISDHIASKYVNIDYSISHVNYKTNTIKFMANYECDTNELISYESKCKTLYNFIDSKLNLRGFLTNEVSQYFHNCNKIRLLGNKENVNLIIDENKCYNKQLIKDDILFAIPTINDYWCKWDGKIEDYGFYYCTLNKYDNILAPCDDIYIGYTVNILKKENRIASILDQFIASQTRTVNKDDVKLFSHDAIRRYIGWLQRSINITTSNYNNINGKEADALLGMLGDEEAHIYNGELRINKEFLIKKDGVLANLTIKELTNIDLYEQNKIFTKINPASILNSVKTDSLGYILMNKNYKKPANLITKDVYKSDVEKYIGYFKIEHENFDNIFKPIEMNKINSNAQPTKKVFKNINNHNQNDITKLLNEGKSFQLLAPPGYGKTTTLKNIIVPYFEKNKIKYIISATTEKSCNNIDGVTIQGIFSRKSKYEIKKHFEGVKYIVIDESSRIDQLTYKMLEFVRDNTSCKFILIGDDAQCKSIDAINETWIVGNFVNEMADYNIVRIESHNNIRYTKELDDILKHIKSLGNSKTDILKYIIPKFKREKKTITRYNLSYLKKTCEIVSDKDHECHTTHSTQGDTIDENYSIHDIYKMPLDVLYTAISRSKSVGQITLIV